ncbi:MAG TPA: hypothetical protein VGQ00_00010 [Candidatus Norongarragalinales archaeon]|jgi:hypothetical protein|nr:hypothetical protein [Candidatus Norongarragalinales archaeon]
MEIVPRIGTITEALAIAFQDKRFIALATVFAVFFAFALVSLTSLPRQSFAGWLYSVPTTTKAFVIAGSVMAAGVATLQAFSFSVFRTMTGRKKAAGSGVIALISSLGAIACCSPLLVPIAAFSGAVAFLELNQSLFSVLSLALLLVALYYSAKPIACEECRVKLGITTKK